MKNGKKKKKKDEPVLQSPLNKAWEILLKKDNPFNPDYDPDYVPNAKPPASAGKGEQ